ncbi:MAG TPA: hypothetical protein DCS28_03550 [Candidatus Moranbacteria bacterium]|nr:hypothetical protein [Candidatus Moranbacteria bacterium]HAT75087.1 hypothetical protein [Candidatus Moranbacteria bacterium]
MRKKGSGASRKRNDEFRDSVGFNAGAHSYLFEQCGIFLKITIKNNSNTKKPSREGFFVFSKFVLKCFYGTKKNLIKRKKRK